MARRLRMADLPCPHRGEQRRIATIPSRSCVHGIKLWVWGCDLHGECATERLPGVQGCLLCPDLPLAKPESA